MQIAKLIIALMIIFTMINVSIFLKGKSKVSLLTSNDSNDLVQKKSLNSIFLGNSSTSITNKTLEIIEISEIGNSCQSPQNTYTDEEILNYFNYKNYSQCYSNPLDSVSFINDSLQVKCEKNPPLYATDRWGREIHSGGDKELANWTSSIPNFRQKQFLFVKCSNDSIYALVFLWRNEQLSTNKRKIALDKRSSSTNMNVLLLVLDSVSRFSSQRNLPQTTKFLQEIQTGNDFSNYFEFYDFKKVAVPHARTILNMAQILYGKNYSEINSTVGSKLPRYNETSTIHLEYQKNAIWAQYSSLGYMTMFNYDSNWDYLSPMTGRKMITDHVFGNFWRYLYGIYGIHSVVDNERCVGGRDAHEFLLDYTLQFYEKYPNNHKFGYSHTNAAHERTGNVKKIDKDLIKFLKKYLSLARDRNEDTALLLISDHGFKDISKAQWDSRSFYEYYTPMSFIVLSKSLVDKLGAREALMANKDRLVSRYDFHLSLQHLAFVPFKDIIESRWYEMGREKYQVRNVSSFFKEVISLERKCEDFGVDKEYCLCSKFEIAENSTLNELVKSEILEMSDIFLTQTQGCSLKNQTKSTQLSIFPLKTHEYGLDTLYNLTLETHSGLILKIHSNFCLESRINSTANILDSLPFKSITYSNENYFLQISNLEIPESCEKTLCSCLFNN